MAGLPDEKWLAEELREIKRRISELEGARSAGFSTLSNGAFRVVDDDGALRVAFGFLGEERGWGWEVRTPNNVMGGVGDEGWYNPWLAHPFIAAGAFTVVTAGAFTPVYQSTIEIMTHEGVSTHVIVTSDVGTTGEIRLKNATAGTSTDVKTIPSGANDAATFFWLHGTPLGTGPARFDIEARRTGGGGNVNIYQPTSINMTDGLQCTAGGLRP